MAVLAVLCPFAFLCLLVETEAQGTPELTILVSERHDTYVTGLIYKIDGRNLKFTRIPLSNIVTPAAIDFDNVTKIMYFTDISKEQVRSASLNGGTDRIVAGLNSAAYPEGLAIDSGAGKIFYTDRGNDVIVSIKMSDYTRTTIINSGLDTPWGIVADTTNKILYWVDHELGQIERCSYYGTNRSIVTRLPRYPTGIAINENTQRLYWCEYNGEIHSIFTSGIGEKKLYFQVTPIRRFMDISLFNGFLYSADLANSELIIIPEDGGYSMKLNSSSFGKLNGIHVFSPNSGQTDCPDGRYGRGCTAVCGHCSGKTICEKTTGTCFGGCSEGYEKGLCDTACIPGTYGKDCKEKCGKCKEGTSCDHVTGNCPNGCQPNWWGTKCATGGAEAHSKINTHLAMVTLLMTMMYILI